MRNRKRDEMRRKVTDCNEWHE